jgi:hypothetical protein
MCHTVSVLAFLVILMQASEAAVVVAVASKTEGALVHAVVALLVLVLLAEVRYCSLL